MTAYFVHSFHIAVTGRITLWFAHNTCWMENKASFSQDLTSTSVFDHFSIFFGFTGKRIALHPPKNLANGRPTSFAKSLRTRLYSLEHRHNLRFSAHYHPLVVATFTLNPKVSGTYYTAWTQERPQGLMKFQRGSLKSVQQNWPVPSAVSYNCFSPMTCSLTNGKLQEGV